MAGTYMTSQIFMSNNLKKGSGTSYHCANFNNLFFQIVGRKKWTFVDPQYESMMYPMFNAKSMDVASFITMVALSQPDLMEKYYPLYKLAPKMEATLEPGDVLMNPPWNWHMVRSVVV
jgi:ribosomal protein L16 Arg81 hydroxylase